MEANSLFVLNSMAIPILFQGLGEKKHRKLNSNSKEELSIEKKRKLT
jgi:hypothetical protein